MPHAKHGVAEYDLVIDSSEDEGDDSEVSAPPNSQPRYWFRRRQAGAVDVM